MDIKPGIYTDLSNEDYHGHHGSYSKSSLSDFSVYPYNLIYQREHRVRKTMFDLGTAAHTAILEPEKFETEIAVCPDELLGKNGAKSTKAYKEWVAAQPADMALLTVAERDRVLRMRNSVHSNPAHSKARDLLTGGAAEVSCFWNEIFKGDENGPGNRISPDGVTHFMNDPTDCHTLMMKCRPDYVPTEMIMVDLKTTATAIDQESFEKQAYNLHYHWSAAMTLRGVTLATGKQRSIYIFVVVEVNPPHEVAVFPGVKRIYCTRENGSHADHGTACMVR